MFRHRNPISTSTSITLFAVMISDDGRTLLFTADQHVFQLTGSSPDPYLDEAWWWFVAKRS